MAEDIKKKGPKGIPGIGYDHENGDFEFRAYNKRQPAHHNVRKCQGGGQRYETTGKEPKQVLNLQCLLNAPDAYEQLSEQFDRLTKDLKPNAKRKLPERQRVVNEGGLQCWLNQSRQKLIYTGEIDLAASQNWQSELLRQAQLLVRRLPASDVFIKVVKSLKKG